MKVRLNKFLSQSGICSRRKADELISASQIKINNKIAKLGDKVDQQNDEVEYKDKIVNIRTDNVYYMLNKPEGYTSTVSDPHADKVVINLVPKSHKVYPAGRLDKNSEGLIILTNDGELTDQLTHPRFQHEKEYYVEAIIKTGKKTEESAKHRLSKFKKGIKIDNYRTKPVQISNIDFIAPELVKFNIILKEGHKRQIRRICEKVDLEVIKLVRIRISKLKLLDLKTGEYKKIEKSDII